MKKKLYEYKGFKVGDKFIITDEPSYWSSGLNNNCPIRNVGYPYHGTIKGLLKEYVDNGKKIVISMDDGNYGWDLKCLIKSGYIVCIRKQRKDKLNKIYDSQKL